MSAGCKGAKPPAEVEGRTLLSNERQTPRKDVHEVRQPVRVRGGVELSDVHDVGLVLEDGGLVLVNVEVVGSREERHDGREASRLCLAVHAVLRRGDHRMVRTCRGAEAEGVDVLQSPVPRAHG